MSLQKRKIVKATLVSLFFLILLRNMPIYFHVTPEDITLSLQGVTTILLGLEELRS